jgi:hypothetical protein
LPDKSNNIKNIKNLKYCMFESFKFKIFSKPKRYPVSANVELSGIRVLCGFRSKDFLCKFVLFKNISRGYCSQLLKISFVLVWQ